MRILKKIGRIFLVLTEEGKHIKAEDIKAILFIKLKEDEHFEKALDYTRKRFLQAEIKNISGGSIIEVIKGILELRGERFSMVMILSLNPINIFFVERVFNCYLLLYNKFDQCFLIRRKTLYEFLAGRKGADKEAMDWRISLSRLSFAKIAVLVFMLPIAAVRNICQSIRLIVYIILNAACLFFKKYWHKLAERFG